MFDIVFSAIADLVVWLASGPGVVVLIALAAFVATRISRLMLHGVIRRLARRSLSAQLAGGSPVAGWRIRSARRQPEMGETGERRRRQRVDAATRMINHLVSVAIWTVAAIMAFHLLNINPTFYLSGAGFLGAGFAIGGQHKVNDYLTGLSVHFEDRYGIGDMIVAEQIGEGDIRGVVDHVGLFSTQLRTEDSTVHVPNSVLAVVRNLSQEAPVTTLRVHAPDAADPERVAGVVRDLGGSEGLTELVFLGDLAARSDTTGEVELDLRTVRSLNQPVRNRLIERAEQRLIDGLDA